MKLNLRVIFFVILAAVVVAGSYLLLTKSTQVPPTQEGANDTKSSLEKSVMSLSSECSGTPTTSQTEGPYYKADSPERKNIAEGVSGEPLTIVGYIYDANCKPLVNAWLDFWQADSAGAYDNSGFNLRGHQFTDQNGKYDLTTIVPKDYGTRPPHIHVKVRGGNGQILTSQLYFPDASQNTSDSIFDSSLLMTISEKDGVKIGSFNFVLEQ